MRRYRMVLAAEVDDRLAIEKWLLYDLGRTHKLKGEWLNVKNIQKALDEVLSSLNRVGITALSNIAKKCDVAKEG